jgi:hypothetical protein
MGESSGVQGKGVGYPPSGRMHVNSLLSQVAQVRDEIVVAREASIWRVEIYILMW